MRDTHVAIIGAGIGGLAAALDCAAAGLRVTLFDRQAVPGGKLRQTVIDGRAIDVGPTVLTMRDVFDDLFAHGGDSLDAHLTLTPQTILARHAWPDGSRLDLHADPEASAEAIGDFAGAAAANGFRGFRRHAAAVYATLDRTFMRAERPDGPLALAARAGLGGLPGLMRIQPYTTMWAALGQHFADPRLRQLFGRYATYCGSSPFAAPATLMLIAHVEQMGVWAVGGGMAALAGALARLAERRGVVLRLGAEVASIAVDHGRAGGVTLRSGEVVSADAVIADCDGEALARGLFGPAAAAATRDGVPGARSLSAVTLALVGRFGGMPLVRHNVFFSDDYAAEFAAIGRGAVPERPTLYLCAQDRGDGAEPPRGDAAERGFVICNAPANGDTHTYEATETGRCVERMIGQLGRCGLTVATSPASMRPTTPRDFAALFPATGGALYGPASHGAMASFRRPGTRTGLPGLYRAGGSVHPGAGVPMAALSGRLAAASLIGDLASTARSRRAAMPGGTATR